MKALYKYTVLLGFVLFFITKSYSQSLPISSYGVWDRGGGIPDYSAPNADFVKGIETTLDWKDIQAGPGTNNCDFSAFQTILDVAVANNKLIRFSVNVGPDCPLWVFDNGVPLVNVISNAPKNDAYANRNPYYPDPEYKAYYFEMIRQFALFLRNQPQVKFNHIAFVQVKTGATGDEEPYKGDVINPIYDLSTAQWEAFRLEAFAKFKENFNDVTTRKIVLTFNNVDPVDQPDAYNYVMTQLDPVLGFGIKGGAFNRGHHLSDEQTYKEQWNPFLINPKVGPGNPNGVKLFSASEMDQSWDKGYFALNYEIGFYWSALGGINTGLSCTNISVSAMTYALANPGIIDIFKMYNRYAQQVYPATATTAFSVFHEGLNSADTVKFPESIYGNATKTNLTRYQNICNNPIYYNRGARIDDPIAVVRGQVFQREDQEFYNDAGWEICEGNIERFMTQINPDATSIGLFRVRGPITATSSKYDRFARSFENSTGKNSMYFQLHNEFPASNKILKFTIIWLDKTAGSTWAFKYRNSVGLQSIPFTGTGTNQWRTETITISDAIINQGGANGSDFMLVNTDAIDDIFNGIEMNILGISKQNQTINFNALPSKTVGDADFSAGATASSGLTVSYTSSNIDVATIVGDTIHIVGGGTSTITASQVGDDYYNPAISVTQDISVTKQNQSITFNSLPLKTAGDSDFSPLATASSGLAVSYTSSNTAVATIVNGNIRIVGGGSSIITASQAGNSIYNAATSVAQNLAVSVVNQATITTSGSWTCPAGVTSIKVEAWGGGGGGGGTILAGFAGGGAGGSYVINDSVTVVPATSYAVTVGAGGALTGNGGANGNNGGNTTFGSTNPIIANGGVAGSGTTAAGQLGSGGTNSSGGSGGTVTLGLPGTSGASGAGGAGGAGAFGGTGAASRTTVANGFSVTTLGGGGGGAYGSVTGSNKGGAGGAGQIKITYTVGLPNAPTIGTATVSGVSGQASISFTAPAFNGNSTITTYRATSSPGGITGTLSQAGSGTILVSGLTNGTVYTFTITATNAVGQSTASSASNAVTPYTVPSAPTIGAAAASGVSGQATVSFTAPTSNGGSPITSYTATSSPGGITGTLSQAGSGTIIVNGLTNGTAYTFTVRATNAGGLSAVSGTSNAVTPISRVPQTITFSALSAVNYGDAVLPGATASSGLPVTYTSDNPLVATTSGSTITVVGAGSVTISAMQAGDGTYAAATPVIQTLVVNKKSLSITTPSIASKVYNSLPDSGVVTPGTLSGFLGTETVTVMATGLYADGNVGTDKLATITYLLADGTNGGKASNYSLASVTATGAITQAPLTVVGIVANNKPEDGNTTATLSALGSLSGVFASDTANVTLVSSSVSANFDSAAVGTAKPLTINGYSITGSASANYSFAQPTGITANITVPTTFYFVSTGTDFNVTSNWWSVSNGTGLNPSNLTTANITYTIYSNATTTAPLTLGSGSKVVVGNASVAPVTLTVTSGFPITGTINIDAALSESNSVIWKDITTPSFGTLDNTSEVHLQAVTNYSTSATFGKLFIDPASGFTIMSGTPTIKTSLTVPFGSGLSFSNANQPYIVINSGASVSIDGYLKTGKVGGAFAYNVTTPVNTLGSLQFAASTPNFTLGSASTIEYSRTTVSSTQTISALPIGVNYANLTITDSGNICNKSFPSSVTVNGTFTLNQSASTLTGCAFLNLANGATIVRTAGALNAAPTFGTSVNVTYNGTTAQTPSFEMPANGSVLNNLMINNPAGVTLGASTTVNGTLALTAGVLTTGLNIVTVAASGSTSRTAGWVNGNLRKFIPASAASTTFEIGDLAANYTPVTTAFTGAIIGATGSIIAKTSASDTTTSGSGIVSTKSVNRTWTLTNDNAVPGLTSYDATFTYASTDNDAGTTPANYAVKLYATAWSTIATSGTTTDTAATATGITGFGEFAIGETPVVSPVATISASGAITFCSGGSVTLSANTGSGLTYLWSPGGATTSSITVTASGSYTVTVTGTGGSTTSAATTVTVIAITTNGSVTASICAGDSYTWPLPNGTGLTYTTAQTGLTNVVGCNTATLHLTINTLSTYYLDADNDGYGSTTTASLCSATAPTGYALNNTDCNDADPTKNATFSFYADVDGDGFGSGTAASLCAVNANTPPAGYSLNGSDCNDNAYSLTNTCSSIVNLRLNVQGYYDADAHAMRAVMANQGVGSSTTDVDDVTVELRDSSTSAVVASVTARLHTDGTATATFGTAPSGSFYIAVKNRNAIQTWSATAQTVGSMPLTYDFTTAANKAYGDNMILLESGVYGFYSGDLNQDEAVDIFDFPLLLNDNDNFSSGYLSTDLNGDGAVDLFDFPLLLNNNDNFIYSSHP